MLGPPGARLRAARGPRSRPRTGPRRPPCAEASSPRAPRGEQPDPLVDPLEHGFGERRGPLGTVREERVERTRVREVLGGPLPERPQRLDDDLGEVDLEVAVHLALVACDELLDALARER